MTSISECDCKWVHALMRFCLPDVVNEIVKEVGPPESDDSVLRRGQWYCVAGQTLIPPIMGKVSMAVREPWNFSNVLSPKAIEMLDPHHGEPALTTEVVL